MYLAKSRVKLQIVHRLYLFFFFEYHMNFWNNKAVPRSVLLSLQLFGSVYPPKRTLSIWTERDKDCTAIQMLQNQVAPSKLNLHVLKQCADGDMEPWSNSIIFHSYLFNYISQTSMELVQRFLLTVLFGWSSTPHLSSWEIDQWYKQQYKN